jgi:outer membrane protein assembly factor BamE (lipoprotein component of BamABCDE complex)
MAASTLAKSACALVAAAGLALASGACSPQVQNHGYILSPTALEQIPPGSSQEQVQVVLGTPSTKATLQGDVFYYISSQTQRRATFLNSRITDQKVLAVYFDRNRKVERIAHYGMQDGKVFDFIGRQTVTSGREITFLTRVLNAVSF